MMAPCLCSYEKGMIERYEYELKKCDLWTDVKY